MRRLRHLSRRASLVVAILVVGGACGLGTVGVAHSPVPAPGGSRSGVDGALSNALSAPRFEANAGQFEGDVRFVSRRGDTTLLLSPDQAVLILGGGEVGGRSSLGMRFVGGNVVAEVTGRGVSPATTNWIVGSDPARWRANVPTYPAVEYKGVYPGVDVVYHGHYELEYDVVVAAGADPRPVTLGFDGADAVRIDGDGSLVLDAGERDVRMKRPFLYQLDGGRRVPVAGGFEMRGGDRAGFWVGAYDRSRPLVIDPVITTSSYIGGGAAENANAVAVDGEGNTYITGYTESADFPTAGPLQASLAEDAERNVRKDVFVAKLNPEGTGVVWSTYLGGRGRDSGEAVAVGADGSVYVTGDTESTDFPTARPFQTANGGGPTDAFVAKLKADGSGVDYASYLGGSVTDGGRGITTDPGGSAYVTGSTSSTNFPSVSALPNSAGRTDDLDAFVVKVIPDGTGVQYATRLGGAGDDQGGSVAIDREGAAYVTGSTNSPGFPTQKPLQAGLAGGSTSDAFVAKLAPAGSSLVYSTFLGGSEADQGAGIAVDGAGNAYVTGSSRSPNFPTASPVQGRNEGDDDAFLSKVGPDGASLIYSTYLGGAAADGGAAVSVDSAGNAYVAGSTGSSNFPTARPVQARNGGGLVDGFVAQLNPAGAVLVSSTYLGGNGDDQVSGVAIDATGRAHVVGYTNSTDLVVARALQPRPGGNVDVLMAIVAETGPGAGVTTAVVRNSAHDTRLKILLGLTLGLLLAALVQTIYLRSRQNWGAEPAYETAGAGATAGEVTDAPREGVTVVGAGQPDAESEKAPADAPVAAATEATTGAPAPAAGAGSLEALTDVDAPAPVGPDGAPLSFWDLFPEGPPSTPPGPGGAGGAPWTNDPLESVFGRSAGTPAPPGEREVDDPSTPLSRLLREWSWGEEPSGVPVSEAASAFGVGRRPEPEAAPPVPEDSDEGEGLADEKAASAASDDLNSDDRDSDDSDHSDGGDDSDDSGDDSDHSDGGDDSGDEGAGAGVASAGGVAGGPRRKGKRRPRRSGRRRRPNPE